MIVLGKTIAAVVIMVLWWGDGSAWCRCCPTAAAGDPPTSDAIDASDASDVGDVRANALPTRFVFAGRQTRIDVATPLIADPATPISWQWMHGHRTLATGSAAVQTRPTNDSPSSVRLTLPPIDAQAVMSTTLVLRRFGGVDSVGGAEPVRAGIVYVYPNDPFSQIQSALRDAAIELFDPPRTTHDIFERSSIPHRLHRRLSTLDAIDRGCIVVGEGLDLDRHRGLAATLAAAAGRGVSVVMFRPIAGTLWWPDPTAVTRLSADRDSWFGDIDRRWKSISGDSFSTAPTRFLIDQTDGQFTLRTDHRPGAWISVRWHHAKPPAVDGTGGRVLLCGVAMIDGWDRDPIVQYLLKEILLR